MKLDLSNNKLRSIPEQIGRLRRLRFADFGANKLENLPEELGDCKSLKELHLNENHLQHLPENLKNLERLETLQLRRNQLTSLPEFIGNFNQLSTLAVAGNHLNCLPESFKRLQNLQKLFLAENSFHAFPEALLYLERLKTFSGYKGFGRTKPLLSFLAACQKQRLAALLGKPFFEILNGDKDAARELSLSALFEGLNFKISKIREVSLQTILTCHSLSLREHPLKKGAGLSVLGRTNFTKTELRGRLQKAGVHYSPGIETETTHLLLGNSPKNYEKALRRPFVFLSERDLNSFLQSEEGRF